jgi:protein-S-isoprenylcysteine O-methyltransferase Ste14
MSDDQPFRLILIVLFAALFPVGMYHRIKSQSTGEKLDRRQEGTFILATLRPIGFALWLGALVWLVDPAWMFWSSISLPDSLRWIGFALMIAGGALILWTFRSLGKNLTDTVVTRREHTLVTRGPYRWVRHPLYAAAAILIVGMSLITANWFFLVTGGIVLALLVRRTRTEEENLVRRFGDDYRAYMARTGRFFPTRVP